MAKKSSKMLLDIVSELEKSAPGEDEAVAQEQEKKYDASGNLIDEDGNIIDDEDVIKSSAIEMASENLFQKKARARGTV